MTTLALPLLDLRWWQRSRQARLLLLALVKDPRAPVDDEGGVTCMRERELKEWSLAAERKGEPASESVN